MVLNVPTLGNKHSQNTVVVDCIIIYVPSTELSPEESFVPYLALHYNPAEKIYGLITQKMEVNQVQFKCPHNYRTMQVYEAICT